MFALSKIWGWIRTAAIAIAAAAFWAGIAYLKGRGDGKAKAENKSLKRDVAARDEQLEMHREADAFEREVAAMTDEQARKEAKRWERR